MNAVMVHGDAVGTTLTARAPAPSRPPARDCRLVDITRLHTADPEHRVPHLAFQPAPSTAHGTRPSCRWARW